MAKVMSFLFMSPALFEVYEIGRNAKFLLPLTNNKWPPRVDPGGHRFKY
jgi:hypothetical protein